MARWTFIAILGIVATVLAAVWLGRPAPLAISPSVGAAQGPADIRLDNIRDAIRRLSSVDSRLTGSPGEREAAQWIQDQLAEAGIADVEVQEFETAAPVSAGARLVAQWPDHTTDLEVFPLWPNLARTPQTGPDGVSGPLVDAGRGTDADLAGKPLRGAIAVVDWNCRAEWMSVPEFGGKAVVFRANPEGDGAAARSKFLTIPGAIPRYYVRAQDAPALDALLKADPPTVTIRCDAAWERVNSRNILARVPTAESGPFRLPNRKPDPARAPVIFHAYYDSVSVVPDLAPGAEQACGAAALLELGRYLKGKPTTRPVYLLFTGAHGQALQGMIHFVRVLQDGLASDWKDAPDSLAARLGKPGLFVGLDLSSQGDQFGLFCCGRFRGEAENLLRPKFSTLALKLSEYAASLAPAADPQTDPPGFVDCVNLTLGRRWWTYFPYQAPFESEIPNLSGFPGATLATLNDGRRYVDTPDDTFSHLSVDTLGRQILGVPGKRAGLADIAAALALWDGPFVSSELLVKGARLRGRVVWLDPERNYTPNEPLAGAVVCLKTQRGDKYLCGTRGAPLAVTNETGEFEFDGLIDITGNGEFANCLVESYGAATRAFLSANPRAAQEYQIARQWGKTDQVGNASPLPESGYGVPPLGGNASIELNRL
ncbi:MAG: M28 family peptidase [Candidatus Sumerlaeota bacterium]|nr:M28 family peptidase [Candidatus Sumerlaeota bacterium]